MARLEFLLPGGERISPLVRTLLLGSFTGRSQADVSRHVEEMELLGVTVPSRLPIFYPAMSCLLTQEAQVEAVGSDSRPEVEFVLFAHRGQWFVTVGNDQFDLDLEKRSLVSKSKNLCQKLVAGMAWPLDEVSGHWDALTLSLSSNDRLLQHGRLEQLLQPAVLLDSVKQDFGKREIDMLFSGTIPFLPDVQIDSGDLRIALHDPVLSRELSARFAIKELSAIGTA
ncbi:DUF2848 domain-containing protein [Starkeya sp. ORNL1]|uniref:DUF2848 family protein n=1 Tax=Starkeya sp. ORNL1 TaxID=2709380 RepID=UPI001462B274|nr:DUF2848 family protein [Starkeya sp. ORNL1]QJP12343.1 DUF2848 domain-containing protein [Starkeya sp. ORNL1]